MKWSDEAEAAIRDINVDHDIDLTAYFSLNTHIVHFKDWDSSIIESKTAQYGSKVEYPAHPDNREDYEPNGWSPV